MEKLETIKTKIKEIDEEIKRKIDFYNEIQNSINKLNNEREIARDDIRTLNGALTAYKQTIEFLESDIQQPVIDAEVV